MKSIWIAKDEDGSVWMFENKPVRNRGSRVWDPSEGDYIELLFDDHIWFPELQWEDEPLELTVKQGNMSPHEKAINNEDGRRSSQVQ